MIPSKTTALVELQLANERNPGPWTAHSENVARAAQIIAAHCPNLDAEKAYVLGLLHDIGRRNGTSAMRHTLDGYDYAMSHGWDEVARICLTHSFPVKDADADIGKKDITPAQFDFLKAFLAKTTYDLYDQLIILCDALADANGFCILEKRFVDTTRRYGIFPFTVDRWNQTFAYKAQFDRLAGQSIYRLLPGIEACIYS